MEYLHSNTTELIFFRYPSSAIKRNGVLKTLTNPPSVIITTAYHQYAVEGFELNVTDYLLKPFALERFLVAVNKVKTAQNVKVKTDQSVGKKDFIFLNVQKKKVKILFSEIVYIESQREYIKINTLKNQYLSKMSTYEIERLLPGNLFKRIHRSFIISIPGIESYTAEMVEVNGVSIPIGRDCRGFIENL